MNLSEIKYLVITPVRDEEGCIEKTIQSMIDQTIRPIKWWIVDDGSTDRTKEIIEKYLPEYKWIHLHCRPDRGYRKSGGGVIEAFYDAYDKVEHFAFDFIVKLDGDLSFGAEYFASCFQRFKDDPQLGIGGGNLSTIIDGAIFSEYGPVFHVRGATKIYSSGCWCDIGGLVREPGWDTIDEVKANMLGYKTERFEDIPLVQHKPTGSADGTWNNWKKNGLANYNTGYHPLFMLAKCIKRLFLKPYVSLPRGSRSRLIMSCGLMTGYINGFFNRKPRPADPDLVAYVRKEQIKKMLGMKTIWK